MRWVGFALRNFKEFPRAVQRDIGQALYAAQRGEAYPFNQSAEGGTPQSCDSDTCRLAPRGRSASRDPRAFEPSGSR